MYFSGPSVHSELKWGLNQNQVQLKKKNRVYQASSKVKEGLNLVPVESSPMEA